MDSFLIVLRWAGVGLSVDVVSNIAIRNSLRATMSESAFDDSGPKRTQSAAIVLNIETTTGIVDRNDEFNFSECRRFAFECDIVPSAEPDCRALEVTVVD